MNLIKLKTKALLCSWINFYFLRRLVMSIENLKFSALLHDIGKFYQRTKKPYDDRYRNLAKNDFDINSAHAKWSADFASRYWNHEITDLVLHHHKPVNAENKELARILHEADYDSSSERIKRQDNETADASKSLLVSVFSEIYLKDDDVNGLNDMKTQNDMYVPLKQLKLNKGNGFFKEDDFDDSIPIYDAKDLNLVEEYKKLWAGFTSELDLLEGHNDFNTIFALVKKYTSAMPSAAYRDIADISLFDHSKTTAALAVARYLFEKDENESEKPYLIINGDISGIQKFIFRISSPQKALSGMSKRLRGRSLYLTLLCDAIADHIIRKLGLSCANILFCGGGRFTIVAPNTIKARKELKEIKKRINKYFIDEFNAELYLAIACQEVSGNELANFGDITFELSNKLTEDKKHKFVENLNDIFCFDEEIDEDSELCSVCGKPYTMINDESICPDCKSHGNLGKEAANADYMIKLYSSDDKIKEESDAYFDILEEGYLFEKDKADLTSKINRLVTISDKVEILKLNDTDFLSLIMEIEESDKVSFGFSFLGNVVPNLGGHVESHEYMPLYFEHLAMISRGANKLGVLKMDVDNLGRIFSQGFKKSKEVDNTSISRISTLSSQLDMFFSGFINNIASSFKVYSKIEGIDGDKFDEIELEIQDNVGDKESMTVYKLKYGKLLTDSEEKILSKYEIPTIYIDYSGGDDLLVIGPYDDIISFAEKLQCNFKKWTCDNDSINLSAGINIISPKFPIGKAVFTAEDYLDAAKSCGRDKITVFGEVVNWNKFETIAGFRDLFEFGKVLEKYCFNGDISKGFVYSLLHLWQSKHDSKGVISDETEWKKENSEKLNSKRYVPLFKYKLRLIKNEDVKNKIDKEGLNLMPWIKIPVSWVSLRMR